MGVAAAAGAGLAGATVAPDAADAGGLGGGDVVVAALGDVEDVLGGDAEAAQGGAEVVEGRLVGAALLCGDQVVKRDAELRRGEGEEVVVDVGDHRELVA